jgi:hypothetical protein
MCGRFPHGKASFRDRVKCSGASTRLSGAESWSQRESIAGVNRPYQRCISSLMYVNDHGITYMIFFLL